MTCDDFATWTRIDDTHGKWRVTRSVNGKGEIAAGTTFELVIDQPWEWVSGAWAKRARVVIHQQHYISKHPATACN